MNIFRSSILAGSVALSLAGCSTLGTGGAPLDLTSFIAQVQATSSAVCSFLPTAETVASIIATGNPIVTTANAVANAICAAVAPAKAAGKLRASQPAVAGVAIHGKFLN